MGLRAPMIGEQDMKTLLVVVLLALSGCGAGGSAVGDSTVLTKSDTTGLIIVPGGKPTAVPLVCTSSGDMMIVCH